MAGSKKIDTKCVDCGASLLNVAPTRKLCYDCARKRRGANRKKYRTVKQKKERGGLRGYTRGNDNEKYCKGCIYWGGGFENTACCNYIFIKGHSRHCPPGKDCTEKVIGKKYIFPRFVDL